MHLAAKRPSLVSKLVLFGPLKSLPEPGRNGCKARAKAVREGGMAACADTVVGNGFAAKSFTSRTAVVGFGRELLSRQSPEGYALACLALAAADDPAWAEIQAPTTIISGSEDKVSSPATCSAIADLLGKNMRDLITWQDVGHWHTLENAEESAAVLRSVIAS